MLRRAVEDLRAEVGSRRRRCLEALSVPADAIVVNVAAQRYDARQVRDGAERPLTPATPRSPTASTGSA